MLADGTTAVAQYRPGDAPRLRPFGLIVIQWYEGRMMTTTTFLEQPSRMFGLFGLSDEFGRPASYTWA